MRRKDEDGHKKRQDGEFTVDQDAIVEVAVVGDGVHGTVCDPVTSLAAETAVDRCQELPPEAIDVVKITPAAVRLRTPTDAHHVR